MEPTRSPWNTAPNNPDLHSAGSANACREWRDEDFPELRA